MSKCGGVGWGDSPQRSVSGKGFSVWDVCGSVPKLRLSQRLRDWLLPFYCDSGGCGYKDQKAGEKSWSGPKMIESLEKIVLAKKLKVLSLIDCGRMRDPNPKTKQ